MEDVAGINLLPNIVQAIIESISYNRVGLDLKNCEIINNKRTKEKFAIGKSWFIDDDIGTFGPVSYTHHTLPTT